ncbi:MAG: histidine kinase [Lentimicrobiaceae bacterium]|nr:histidine kinase [Lentimicrobiaceae bacterium]
MSLYFRITLIAILILCRFDYALFANIPYKQYTTNHGLPHVQVQRVFQDSKGYIWVGTKGGLAKFNGDSFETIINLEYVDFIGETNDGTVVIYTKDGVYTYKNFELKKILGRNIREDILVADKSFFLYGSGYIFEYNLDGIIINKFSTENQSIKFDYIVYNRVSREILFVSDGCLYSYCQDKLKLLDGTNGFKIVDIGSWGNELFYSHVRLSDREFEIRDIYSGVTYLKYIKDGSSVVVEKVNNFPVEKLLISIPRMFSCNILVYDYGNDIKYIERLLNLEYTFESILDLDGNIWVCSDEGLFQLFNCPIVSYPKSFISNIWTLVEDDRGDTYAGAYMNGLYKIDLDKAKYTKIQTPLNNGVPITSFYFSACKDDRNRLFFPSQDGVVMLEDGKTKLITNNVSVTTAYDSKNKIVYVGARHSFGMIDENLNVNYFIDSTKKLIPTRSSSFAIEKNGNVWMGSLKNLLYYDKNENKLTNSDSIFNNILRGIVIILHIDAYDNLWIGTTKGLYHFDKATQTARSVGSDIFSSYIVSINDYNNEYIIVGTSHELFFIDFKKFYNEKALYYKMYNHRNGYEGQEIAAGGLFIKGSNMYVPCVNGIFKVDLDAISSDYGKQNLFITDINGKSVGYSSNNKPLCFKVDKNVNNVSINFELVGFSSTTQRQYSYILEGHDEKWSRYDKQGRAIYSNLKSGKYVYKIRAKRGSNLLDDEDIIQEIPIVVELSFWKEPYFYKVAFIILSVLLLVIAFVTYYYLKNKLKNIENKRKIKFQEVAILQTNLNSHFVFNSLTSIQNFINANDKLQANNYLVKFSRLIRKSMEASIKNTKILIGDGYNNNVSVQEEIGMLTLYVQLAKMDYPDEKITFDIKVQNPQILEKYIPPFFIQPFVENSVMHGLIPKEGNGNMSVEFSEENDVIVCKITDDGIGRKKSEERKKKRIATHKSRGMQLVNKRAEVLRELGYDISINISDNPIGGTIVEIKFKLENYY